MGDSPTIKADWKCEAALLASIGVKGNRELLAQLEERDFFHDGPRFVFRELRAMAEAGEPIGDPIAKALWFTSPTVRQRAADIGEEFPAVVVAKLFGEFVTHAHDAYYFRRVRRDRIRRALDLLGTKILEKNAETIDPLATLEWIQAAINDLWGKSATALGEDLQGTQAELESA